MHTAESDTVAWLSLLALAPGKRSRSDLVRAVLAGASPHELLAARPFPGAPTFHSLVDHSLVGEWRRRMAGASSEFIPIVAPPLASMASRAHRPPMGLFARGRIEILDIPAVAIVGRRAATTAGSRLAREVAADIAAEGHVVASGLAEGIDAAAHRGALDASGDTIAVLGTGIDVPYPLANRDLYEEIAARGLLLSEYPPGAGPRPGQFPARNRIVVALSRAVVVIEAGARSGALITAARAQEAGVPVFAVPATPGVPESRGTNALLKSGSATLIESGRDVMKAIGAGPGREHEVRPAAGSDSVSGLDRSPLLARLGRRGATVDDLASDLGCPVSELMAELLRLELLGLAEATDGGLLWRRTRS